MSTGANTNQFDRDELTSFARMARRALMMLVDVALALHLMAAAFWLWFSPRGFPFDCGPFWTNSVLPVAAMGIAGVGLIAMHFGRRSLAGGTVLCFATAWIAAAIAGRVAFPISLAIVWVLFLAVGCAGAVLFTLVVRGARKAYASWLAFALFGVVTGMLVVRWQIPEPPSTIPWKTITTQLSAQTSTASSETSIVIADGVSFQATSAVFGIDAGDVHVSLSPLLEFDRISRDRFWSLFAPRAPDRHFVASRADADEQVFFYDDHATVSFPKRTDDAAVELQAYSTVELPTYSHLNRFTYLEIGGHKALALSFSPCPQVIFDVLPADYPSGRPARFAYLDAAGQFHVCEAYSGEKGPFRSLGSGRLGRGEPLAIGLHDDGKQVATILLADWSAQASTAISPTAGWGVSVNAIEFQRFGDVPTEPAGIWITLAATSVGRGFDTVGHAAGTYRNRISIRRESNPTK